MPSSSEILVYSVADFNRHITFQIHYQDAGFTKWLRAQIKCKYDFGTVKSISYPALDVDGPVPKIFLRGTDDSKDTDIVQDEYDPSNKEPIIDNIHRSLKQVVEDYRQTLQPTDSTDSTVRL